MTENKKVLVISGGSDGVGKNLAAKLNKDWQVVILARNKEKTEKVAKELGVDFKICDVKDLNQIKNSIRSIISKYTKIDCLVNNAGIHTEGKLVDVNYEDIENTFNTNTLGTIFLTKEVLPHMIRAKSGRVINIVSQSGLTGKSERSIYNSSKWAITGFTKSLEQELASSGISVCGFYPAGIKTNLFTNNNLIKDTDRFMDLNEAVRALEFIINTSSDMNISELGLKSINNILK